MPKTLNLQGERFGKLKVLELAGKIKSHRYWYCECECGIWVLANTSDLRSGKKTKCEYCEGSKGNYRHGHNTNNKQTTEYNAWRSLRNRKVPMVPEWKHFKQFIEDVGERPTRLHLLSRQDINKPHGPNNTYWRNADDERKQRLSRNTADEFCLDMSDVSESD